MDCRIKSGNDAVFVEALIRDYDSAEEKTDAPLRNPPRRNPRRRTDRVKDHADRIVASNFRAAEPGKRAITGDTALRLGHWFQTSAQFWLNLQSAYDLRAATCFMG
jgi:hypothetical protein